MRKEYNDRHIAPLVNPPVTYGEYEQVRNSELETMRRFEEFQSSKPESLTDWLKRLDNN